MPTRTIRSSPSLANVRYEIRGRLARRAQEMERMGYDIVMLNIGNPGAFGFRTPETMRLAMIENLRSAEGYCHQKGIFPAREAVVMQQQERGVRGVTADDVFIGNGVSELIDLTLRALLAADEEVLVPSPDYPLWTAAVNLNRGRAVHYPCRPERGFIPDPDEIESLITKRTRAIVVINPNNPTGAVYPRRVLEAIGCRVFEMPRHRECGLCCGAGGGRIWMQETPGAKERPAESRVREAAAVPGVGVLVVTCPKDLVMFQDALKTTGLEGKIVVKDLIELVDEALGGLTAQ